MNDLKKIVKTYPLSDWEILTDDGFIDVINLHETIPYKVWVLRTNNFELRCADNHIVFNEKMEEMFVKNVDYTTMIMTKNGPEFVLECYETNEIETMYDFELSEKSNHRYYTSGILSHNTALIEGLAQLIVDGKAPRILLGKRVYALDLASLVAGTKYRGQFEERMKALLDELQENPDVIIFIDELHTIVGAGNSSGSLDASNIFKPALARGEIQIIGATTLDEYRENIEKDGALTRRFQQVLIEEPTLVETKIILMNVKEKYEQHHKVVYTEEAIDECVKLSERYITDRAMPDKALDVMDVAGASTNVSVEIPESIKELEERKKVIQQRKMEVVQEQHYEEAAKLRDDERRLNSELGLAKETWFKRLDKKKTIVDADLIAESISNMTGIPLNKISAKENKRLLQMEKELITKIIGQDEAVGKISKAIKRNRLGIKDKNKPIGSFMCLGPTGVGKCICSDTQIHIKNVDTGVDEYVLISTFKNMVTNTNSSDKIK